MTTNIFSTYSQGENRVTASILAVLGSLSLHRIERLIGALLEQAEFELVRFQNQPSRGAPGVPDAEISSSCRILVETKTVPNAVRRDQLERHLQRLDASTERFQALLVLTPDDDTPPAVTDLAHENLVWASFARLDQSIDELLDDPHEVISEREAFLLRELQAMLAGENLLRNPVDVVIVAAHHAWPEYLRHSAYICQANRPFQQVQRLGFYSHGVVNPLIPRILASFDEVELQRGGATGDERFDALVDTLLADPNSARSPGETYKIILLTSPDDPETLKLDKPIPNDLKARTGKNWAFTMSQRYVMEEALLGAKATSDLVM